jgi:phage-related protein
MNWLQFKDNIQSDFGLIVASLGRRQRAEEQIDIYEIPYRNDKLIIHSNTYKPYLREIEFVCMDRTKIQYINQWLYGRGKLRTSIDNGGYFIASIITGLPYERMINEVDSFQVGFEVNPFFYLDCGDEIIEITSETKLCNPGTVYSEPHIKIIGSGNITLTINDTVITLTGVSDYIELDSELKIAYKDTVNQGDKMEGEFPVIEVGDNVISFTGSVTKVEVTPKWRQL